MLHLRGQIVIGGATETLSEMVRAQIGACALVLDLAELARLGIKSDMGNYRYLSI